MTKSDTVGIDKYINSLQTLLCIDRMTRRMPFVIVLIELIIPIDNVHVAVGSFKYLTNLSGMKLAVAHVSSKARHLIRLCLLSYTNIIAVVNCECRRDHRHVALSPPFFISH